MAMNSMIFSHDSKMSLQIKRLSPMMTLLPYSVMKYSIHKFWKFEELQVTCGTLGLSTARVKLTDANGHKHIACSVGTGPVDAAYKAVYTIVEVPLHSLGIPGMPSSKELML